MSDKPIYLAAPWLDYKLMPERAKLFEDAGFRITHKWWQYEGENQDNESKEFLQTCAMQDFLGVHFAKAVVVFNTAKSEGKATEQGIALAQGKPIVVINDPTKVTSNIFHHLSNYKHVGSVEEAIDKLREVL